MKVSYEPRHDGLRGAVGKILHSYGAPLGMFLFFMLAALYVFMGRANRAAPDFPRTSGQFLQAAKAERRLAELQPILAANPDDMQALAESGRLKYQLGQTRYVEAIADLERARSLGLTDARTFYYLGSMYQAVGLYDFSAQEYRKFLNNFPKDAEARMLLGKLCYVAGDYAGAVKEYELLLKEGNMDPVLLENLALARWKNGLDYAKTLSDLRALGPAGAFLADYAEGRINYEGKDYEKASVFLRRAAAVQGPAAEFSDRAGLLWLAGDSAYKSKDTEGASGYLQELLKLNPAHEEGRVLLAKLEKERKADARAAAKAVSRK
jgi:tetratricopeptide (TPR) repeat protein